MIEILRDGAVEMKMKRWILTTLLLTAIMIAEGAVVSEKDCWGTSWNVTLLSDGSCRLDGLATSDSGIHVPSSIDVCYEENSQKTVTYPVSEIGYNALKGRFVASISIAGLRCIHEGAFCDARFATGDGGCQHISLPETIESIGKGAFQGSNIITIDLPQSLTKIPDRAFANSSLSECVLPEGVVSVGNDAFSGCPLSLIALPKTLTSLGTNVFAQTRDTHVRTIKIADLAAYCSLTFDESFADDGHISQNCRDDYEAAYGYFSRQFVIDGESVTELIIPVGVSRVPDFAFCCGTFTNIVLSEGVAVLGECAFANCRNLSSCTVPSSCRKVGASAFDNCRRLNQIRISDLSSWRNIDFMGSWSSYPSYRTGGYYDRIGDDGLWQWLVSVYHFVGRDLVVNGTPLRRLSEPNAGLKVKNYAFENFTGFSKIEIPGNVEYIGTNAFLNCKANSIEMRNGVREIASGAFEGVEMPEDYTLVIPASVLEIGEWAFAGTTVSNILVFARTTTLPAAVFSDSTAREIKLPNSLNHIGESCFSGSGLVEMTLPSSVVDIGPSVFELCCNLKQVKLSDNLKFIPSCAFWACESLSSITIPNRVTRIRAEAFAECYMMTNLVIGTSVSRIGEGAFWGCSSIESLELSESVESLGASAFGFWERLGIVRMLAPGLKISYDYDDWEWADNDEPYTPDEEDPDYQTYNPFEDCTAVTNLTVASNEALEWFDLAKIEKFQYLGDSCRVAGKNFSKLKSLAFGPAVESVEAESFTSCTGLETVAFKSAESLSIGSAAFSGCTGIKSLLLPACGLMVGDEAFSSCSNLVTLSFLPKARPEFGNRAFSGCISLCALDLHGVKSIGAGAFEHCVSLTEIQIPSDMQITGRGAFAECVQLKKLGIEFRDSYEDGITNLFWSNEDVKCIIAPQKVDLGFFPNDMSTDYIEELTVVEGTTAGSDHLYTPASAKRVNLPASLVDVKKLAIGGPKYTVAEANTKYAHDDNGSLRSKDGTEMLGWANVSSWWYGGAFGETPGGLDYVCKIGDRAFQNCDKLRYLTFDSHVTTIGKEAYKGLPNLECVSFGSKVSSIGDGAFEDCPSLRIVNPFPKSLGALGKRAFANCTATGNYVFEGKPPKVNATNSAQYVFAGAPGFSQCQGEYFYKNYASWTNKLGKAGIGPWQGIYWFCAATNAVEYNFGNLSPTMRATCDRLLEECGFTANEESTAELAEGTMEEDLVESDLLGVEPTLVTVDNTAYFSTDASFSIEDFQIDTEQKTATLRVAVTTENGQIPALFALNGLPDIQVKESLSDEWQDLCIGESFRVEDVRDQKAVMSVTVDLSNYKFFRAKVD